MTPDIEVLQYVEKHGGKVSALIGVNHGLSFARLNAMKAAGYIQGFGKYNAGWSLTFEGWNALGQAKVAK